jgi:transcriptional antiterminator Rof (Rho-off)
MSDNFNKFLKKHNLLNEHDLEKLEQCLIKTSKAHNVSKKEILLILGKKYGFEDTFDDIFMSEEHVETREIQKFSKRKGKNFNVVFDVNYTGAREGEILVGYRCVAKGAMIKIIKGVIGPSKKELDILRNNEDDYKYFLESLNSIPFFENKTNSDREKWLKENELTSNVEITDNRDCVIEILDISDSDFKKLDEDILEKAMSGPVGAYELEQSFPRKLDSKARRPTLIFLSTFWKITTDYKIVADDFSGVTLNLRDGTFFNGKSSVREKTIILSIDENQEIGIIKFEGKRFEKSIDNIKRIAEKHFGINDVTFKELYSSVGKMCLKSPASIKSLLQKCVRFASTNIRIMNEDNIEKIYSTSQVFVVASLCLIIHSGVFVPDIQRFVGGCESFCKRLVVIAFEDSYVDPKDEHILVSLLIAALTCQKIKGWLPSEELLIQYIQFGLALIKEPRCYYYQYDSESKEKLITYTFVDLVLGDIKDNITSLEMCSFLLDTLKSLSSDYIMVRSIVYHANSPKGIKFTHKFKKDNFPKIMYLEHCVDQHWAPSFIYYCDSKNIEQYKSIKSGGAFGRIFKNVFVQVTGFNPRKTKFNVKEFTCNLSQDCTSFISTIQHAQLKYLDNLLYVNEKELQKSNMIKYKFTDHLSEQWIAGMIGAIEVKVGKVTIYCTLDVNDLHNVIPIKRPTRDMKKAEDGELTAKVKDEAIKKCKDLLVKGVALNKCDAPLDILKGSKLYLLKGQYSIKLNNGKTVEIQDVLDIEKEFNVDKNAFTNFKALCEKTNIKVLKRSLMYMSTKGKYFEMLRISRDGTGVTQTVLFDDVAVFDFIYNVQNLFPSIFKLKDYNPTIFEILFKPMFWKLYNLIVEYINTIDTLPDIDIEDTFEDTIARDKSLMWKGIHDDKKRTLLPHQESSLEEMIQNHEEGVRGNFLWITVGLGKTMITLKYLYHLYIKNELCPYIIYTLPKSAIDNVLKEIHYFGFEINYIIPIKSAKSKSGLKYTQSKIPKKYCINIIEHDHLRLCENEFVEVMSQGILVVDEVHKTLADTKRTSVALELAQLCKEFIVFTGTPIIDKSTFKLVQWLKQMIPFEVNDKNFWVAANGMISKKVRTGVKTEHYEHSLEIIENAGPLAKKEYFSLVPKAMGGKKSNPSNGDLIRACEICYDYCYKEMVDLTYEYAIKKKIGVMLVGKDKKDCEKLQAQCIKRGIKKRDVYLFDKEMITLTDESVGNGSVHDYKVVIVPLKKSEGYTLTRLGCMITCVYPSNNATREQIEGRINRLGQLRSVVEYHLFTCGILTLILKKHKDAKSLSIALEALAEYV